MWVPQSRKRLDNIRVALKIYVKKEFPVEVILDLIEGSQDDVCKTQFPLHFMSSSRTETLISWFLPDWVGPPKSVVWDFVDVKVDLGAAIRSYIYQCIVRTKGSRAHDASLLVAVAAVFSLFLKAAFWSWCGPLLLVPNKFFHLDIVNIQWLHRSQYHSRTYSIVRVYSRPMKLGNQKNLRGLATATVYEILARLWKLELKKMERMRRTSAAIPICGTTKNGLT